MNDLILVPKSSNAQTLEGSRTGRPSRKKFGLRHYWKSCTLALPPGTCEDGDRIDFFMSKTGFAIQIGPSGGRSISGKKNTRTATVPIEIYRMISHVKEGAQDLVSEDRQQKMWFFPFNQFPKE